MALLQDTRKLAQLLLKDRKIDRSGFDQIMTRLTEKEKSKTVMGKRSFHSKAVEQSGADVIRFISGLNLKCSGRKNKPVGEEEIVKSVATHFKLPYKKLDPLDLDINVVTRTIPKPFALKHMIVPLSERDGVLNVALIDPESQEAVDGIARVTGKKINTVLASPGDIQRIINEFFGFRSSVSKAEEQISGPHIDLGNLEQLNHIKRPDQIQSNDEHIKNAVDYLFNSALELRASDIHVEPKREISLVRFRIDGLLHEVYKVPKGIHQAIVSRIKLLSRLNIAEKRIPQDGRIRLEYENGSSEIRVSTMPVAFGEKLVMRVLRQDMLLRDMESLGFFPEDLIKLERSLNKPHGIILVTGPTGSGKTTTLYSALSLLANSEKNIVTVEDPIETICPDFNQVAVQPSIGITFSSSIRTILRQDPDIIMIGEIRDYETAENAIQAALTGHLVLSTLHTNDTTSTITRLLDLGVKPYQINSSVVSIIAQRLVRIVCADCAVKMKYSKKKLASLGVKIDRNEVALREGKGCQECRFTGYRGRTGIYEALEMNDTVRRMVQEGQSVISIRKHALDEGMTTIRDDLVRKMLKGVTTLSEVLRVGSEF